MRVGAFGSEPDSFAKFALRRPELPPLKVHQSQIKVARIVAGIVRNFSFEFAARIREGRVTFLEEINRAQIGMRSGSLRIQFERLAILGSGNVKSLSLLIGAPNEHVQFRGRSERGEHFVEDICRVRQLIQLEIGKRQAVGHINVRSLRQYGFKLAGCRCVITLHKKNLPQQALCGESPLIFCQNRSKYWFRTLEMAGAEVERREAHLNLHVRGISRSGGLEQDKRLLVVLRKGANGRQPLKGKRNDLAILTLSGL